MSFRDFITNFLFRSRLEREFEHFRDLKPPANPSRRYIDKRVRQLLDPRKQYLARKELELIGPAAAPSLAAALADKRFQSAEDVPGTLWSPYHLILELLVPHDPASVRAATLPRLTSTDENVRKTAARHLASIGHPDTIPALAKLLKDPDGYVRSAVTSGMHAAADRAGQDFLGPAYNLLLAECDQEWPDTNNSTPPTAIAIDKARAAVDFASPRWLTPANPIVHIILGACNRAEVSLPVPLLQSLLDHALPLATSGNAYPNEYVAAEALKALAAVAGERIRPLLESSLDHPDDRLQEAAAEALVKLAGIADPGPFVIARIYGEADDEPREEAQQAAAYAALTPPQRTVYLAFNFDAEVSNGGLTQFFGNSAGDHAADTLDALRTLHPPAHDVLLAAMTAVGPLARERDRNLRLTAFQNRYDELQNTFAPLESAYYESAAKLRQAWLLYATKHPADFPRPTPSS